MPRMILGFAVLGVAVASSCVNGRRGEAESAPRSEQPSLAEAFQARFTNSAATPAATAKNGAAQALNNLAAGLAATASTASQPQSSCPSGMILVSGQYCPNVEQRCIRWLESEGRFKFYRCAEYARPAKCASKRKPMRYCIDRDEYVPPHDNLPASNQSWTMAQNVCSSLGKRVCMESEWQFACEGEEMRPYPYGFTRDADACNADRVDIYRADGQLLDLRDGKDGHPRCVSPFGVHHLSGNLEEWTTIDGSNPPRPAMKGAYWQPSRNHCRSAQTAHDRYYHGTETGFRCCKDVE